MAILLEHGKLLVNPLAKVCGVHRRQVGESAIFGPAPHAFVGIQFRGVARQRFRDNFRVLGQVRLDEPRFAMKVRAIPNHCERAGQLPFQVTQEGNDVLGVRVGVVGQQREIKVGPAQVRAQRDATDGRQAIASIPAFQQGRLALRRPRATHGRRQHEAAFIEKNDVCMASARGFQDVGKDVAFPVGDGFVIPFASAATGFLRSPLQSLPQKPADVIVME